jgi:hypothetical protein
MIPTFSSIKQDRMVQFLSLAALALAVSVAAIDVRGMDTKPKSALAELDLVPAETPAPKSVFDLSQPYKDPFFPNSTRLRVKTVTAVVVNTSDPSQYSLKGISGVPGQEVVIINNRNAAAGETVDVTLPSGTIVRIQVIKIDQHSATILPEGQRDPFPIYLPKEDW